MKRGNFWVAKNIAVVGNFNDLSGSYRGWCHVVILKESPNFHIGQIVQVVRSLSRSAQSQEQLTTQIAEMLESTVKPLGVGVFLDAQYLRMVGWKNQRMSPTVTTLTLRGKFRNQKNLRQEVLGFVQSFV